MKSTNRIYSFFIVIALLFWNPISFYLIYGDNPIYHIKLLHVFYWSLLTSGIIIIILLSKNKLNDIIKNSILTLSFTSLLFSALVILNIIIGLSFKNTGSQSEIKQGLIFEPNSKASYQTVEFNFSVEINSIGLRDIEIQIEKGDKFRILCFGDSYTFGWGVDIENSWPKKLEHYFHEAGLNNIEVINCGQPGQYTTTYKNNMAKVIPILKPDLVLVGVLQGDDLAQLYENNFKFNEEPVSKFDKLHIFKKIKYVVKTYLKASFGNILSLIKDTSLKTIDINSAWKTSSNNMINGFNRLQKIRFYTLTDTVQNLFKSGNLNPGLLNYYINFTDAYAIFNNPNHAATKFSMKEMDRDIKDMKAICQENNCNLIFLNLPENDLTGHIVIRTPSDVLNTYFEKNNKIDSIYNSIATLNSLPYIQLTDYFLSLENKTKYFFLYDGHPNENGYEEIANYIGAQLIEQNSIKNK